MGRTSRFDAVVKVKDLCCEDSPWLNLYKATDLVPILGLFNKAREDGRRLRFLTRGPDARACMQAIFDMCNQEEPPSIWEAGDGIGGWSEGRWRGVRRAAAEAEQYTFVDLSPILTAMATGRSIS